jgi:enoyl-CoA hydratase
VNQTLDVMSLYATAPSVVDIHPTGHGHALGESGLPILMLLDEMKSVVSKSKSSI